MYIVHVHIIIKVFVIAPILAYVVETNFLMIYIFVKNITHYCM